MLKMSFICVIFFFGFGFHPSVEDFFGNINRNTQNNFLDLEVSHHKLKPDWYCPSMRSVNITDLVANVRRLHIRQSHLEWFAMYLPQHTIMMAIYENIFGRCVGGKRATGERLMFLRENFSVDLFRVVHDEVNYLRFRPQSSMYFDLAGLKSFGQEQIKIYHDLGAGQITMIEHVDSDYGFPVVAYSVETRNRRTCFSGDSCGDFEAPFLKDVLGFLFHLSGKYEGLDFASLYLSGLRDGDFIALMEDIQRETRFSFQGLESVYAELRVSYNYVVTFGRILCRTDELAKKYELDDLSWDCVENPDLIILDCSLLENPEVGFGLLQYKRKIKPGCKFWIVMPEHIKDLFDVFNNLRSSVSTDSLSYFDIEKLVSELAKLGVFQVKENLFEYMVHTQIIPLEGPDAVIFQTKTVSQMILHSIRSDMLVQLFQDLRDNCKILSYFAVDDDFSVLVLEHENFAYFDLVNFFDPLRKVENDQFIAKSDDRRLMVRTPQFWSGDHIAISQFCSQKYTNHRAYSDRYVGYSEELEIYW